VTTTTTPDPVKLSTSARAHYEARQILVVVRTRLPVLDITGVELRGTFPIVDDRAVDFDVVKVHYTRSTVQSPFSDYTRAFDIPPAAQLECLNSAFA